MGRLCGKQVWEAGAEFSFRSADFDVPVGHPDRDSEKAIRIHKLRVPGKGLGLR